jgi:peptide/nickel transport system ATP-binding protein
MPDPEDLPAGCKFYERCNYRMDKCAQKEPKQITKGTHSIKYYLFENKWGK